MNKKGKKYSSEWKVKILKKHLDVKVRRFRSCDQFGLAPICILSMAEVLL